MQFRRDRRTKIALLVCLLSWGYFALYLLTYMGFSYGLGIKPYILGLPRWVAIGSILTPLVFVLLLILVAEKLIPDLPLAEEEVLIEEKQRGITEEKLKGKAREERWGE